MKSLAHLAHHVPQAGGHGLQGSGYQPDLVLARQVFVRKIARDIPAGNLVEVANRGFEWLGDAAAEQRAKDTRGHHRDHSKQDHDEPDPRNGCMELLVGFIQPLRAECAVVAGGGFHGADQGQGHLKGGARLAAFALLSQFQHPAVRLPGGSNRLFQVPQLALVFFRLGEGPKLFDGAQLILAERLYPRLILGTGLFDDHRAGNAYNDSVNVSRNPLRERNLATLLLQSSLAALIASSPHHTTAAIQASRRTAPPTKTAIFFPMLTLANPFTVIPFPFPISVLAGPARHALLDAKTGFCRLTQHVIGGMRSRLIRRHPESGGETGMWRGGEVTWFSPRYRPHSAPGSSRSWSCCAALRSRRP